MSHCAWPRWGLESGSGLLKLGKSVQGGLWGTGEAVAMQAATKQVAMRTQTTVGTTDTSRKRVAGFDWKKT